MITNIAWVYKPIVMKNAAKKFKSDFPELPLPNITIAVHTTITITTLTTTKTNNENHFPYRRQNRGRLFKRRH